MSCANVTLLSSPHGRKAKYNLETLLFLSCSIFRVQGRVIRKLCNWKLCPACCRANLLRCRFFPVIYFSVCSNLLFCVSCAGSYDPCNCKLCPLQGFRSGSLLRFISLLLYFANLLSAKCILLIYYP